MALFQQVKCGRCDRNYSSIHSKCPYCGAKKNRDGKNASGGDNTKWQVIVGLVVLILIIVAVVVLLAQSLKDREPEPSPGQAAASATPKSGTGVTTVTASPTHEPTAPPTATPSPTPSPTPEPVVNSIVLSREDFTLSGKGDSYTIVATISPAGSNAEIIWISEDPNVATVDETGKVVAVANGTTIVSATAGGITKECVVRVRNAGEPAPSGGGNEGSSGSGTSSGSSSVSLSHTDVTIHSGSGETFMLKVNGAGDGATVTYSSSASGVASVESNGRVKAESNGTANITVKVTAADGTETTLTCVVRVVS